MRYAFDTNTLSYLWRNEGLISAKMNAQLLNANTEIVLPTHVIYELEAGAQFKPKWAPLIAQTLSWIKVLDFDVKSARMAAIIFSDLKRKGSPIGLVDLFIAATAMAHDAVLVSHNTREFSRIPELKLENWYE